MRVRVGNQLLNAYFQPCCDMVVYTKVELYYREADQKQLMRKYKVEEDSFFLSINGLAYGDYAVKVIQYDENQNILIESDYCNVSIENKAEEKKEEQPQNQRPQKPCVEKRF